MRSASTDTDTIQPAHLFKARVKENIKVSGRFYILKATPETGFFVPAPLPGQFFMLGLDRRKDPLLKRPFCYFRVRDGALEILYRIVGKATFLMRELREGDRVEVLGPLGNPYPLPGWGKHKKPLVVAGGVGIASVFPLLEALKGKAVLFYGGRSRDELVLTDELQGMTSELHLASDDGSAGFKGAVTDVLADYFKDKKKSDFIIYACGPNGMLKAVCGMGLRGYISSEEKMACGIGVCLGCAIKTRSGFKRTCKEGPVFDMDEVVFE
ncbi:MAG: dihydroorotate dehydrogenase electron transfer subunit [Nitrospiraceae bacterium]|nr:dihydroorotate dehydrogenase electron transfer subunit [Nitrospiraceae bacterium]